MQAPKPGQTGNDENPSTPSQRLREIFRLPRRGAVRGSNDNPAPMGHIVKRAASILIPIGAILALGLAVMLGAR